MPASHTPNNDFQKTNDPVLNSINKDKYQPSIIIIYRKIEPESKIFSINLFILFLCDIPTKFFIENCEYFACYFHENINYCLYKYLLFPLELRSADIALVYKKKSKSSKDN